jgi:hypothetical protein
MTQPSETRKAIENLTKEMEEGQYHPDNIGTEIDNLSGPSSREVLTAIAPAVAKDLVNNAVNSTEVAPEPPEEPF